jgi:dihydroorotase-like cyclic amidohydrolase
MLMPVMLDAAARGELTYERAVSVLTDAPARRFGLYPHKGTIQAGADADIVLCDTQEPTTVRVESFVSRAGGVGLPYDGMVLKGRLRRTLLHGRTVFADGEVVGEPRGRFVTPAR